MNKPTIISQSVAGSYLDALHEKGIKYVFANAGTDFAPVIEAMVAAAEQGRPIPKFITVPHENVAVSMAHGYYLATGQPAAVMVHVTVGTANALCGLMNASRDNAPILLVAGHTPSTETGNIGSRNAGIHWGQDSFDQGGMLREYVKWDYELRAGQKVEDLVERALDIAMSEPRGPVYLHMPRELLGEQAPITRRAARRRPLGSAAAVPSREAITRAAQALAAAEFPLIMVAYPGRDPDNVSRLADLAAEFGIAVGIPMEPSSRVVNIPTSHPMYLGMHPSDAISRADVIVALDCEVPWMPSSVTPRSDVLLIQISADPFFSRYPIRGFEADLPIAGSSSAALLMLHEALQQFSEEHQALIDKRREIIRAMSRVRTDRLTAVMREAAGARPIHPAWVAYCINAVKTPDTVIVNEIGAPLEFLNLEQPGTYFSSSLAGGLGFGMGASLGAKLGTPDRHVILVVGDGSYMFGNPTATHFVARTQGLATTTIIMNNQRWNAVHLSTMAMYPQGRAAKVDLMPLVDLGPAPDYEKIMQACGGMGEKVDDPAQLQGALRRALEANDRGIPALLNVMVKNR
jgi:acetolactate synthase-1/2/3 large subunit